MTIDIEELRELAEDLYVNGYNRYSSAMSQAADELEQLRAKIAEMEKQEPAAWMNAKRDMTFLYGPYNNDDTPLYALPGAKTQGE